MMVRISLKNISDEDDPRIRFDLVLNENKKPQAEMAFFGFRGSFQDPTFSNGIMLSEAGVIDMGCGFYLEDRQHKTNLLSKQILIGEYVTVWWNFSGDASEAIYSIEAITTLSSITEKWTYENATHYPARKIEQLPRFRGRVKKSFDIIGYDDVVYRPPVGVEGDLAVLQGYLVFYPDGAISQDGLLISEIVDPECIDLINDLTDSPLMATIRNADDPD